MRKFLFSMVVSGLTAGVVMAGPPAGGGKSGAGQAAGGKGHTSGSVQTSPSQHTSNPALRTGGSSWQMPKSSGHHNGGGQSSPGQHSSSSYVNYHKTHGTSFSGGYCYKGQSHNHWSYSGYSSKYGCNCYWCPSTCVYYYWCQPSCCYYPVSYYNSAPCPPVVLSYPAPAPYCPPTQYSAPAPYQVQTQVQTQTQTQTQSQSQLQGPPAGVPPLPQ